MTGRQKVGTYILGFGLGCLLLLAIPRQKEVPKVHPWHAQTAPEGYFPRTVTDDFGRELTIEKQPRHLISLAPSITEILFSMEMGDHLLAVTRFDDYPEEARALRDAGAQVGEMGQPNLEAILAYRPDLVLATTFTPKNILQQINRPPRTLALGFAHDSFEDIREDIQQIGMILGVPGKALDLLARLDEQMNQTEQKIPDEAKSNRPVTLLLYGLEADLRPGWSPGGGSWVSDLIDRAGGENFIDTVSDSWGQPNLEAILSGNPEILLIRDGLNSKERTLLRERVEQLKFHPVWRKVKAVESGRVHILEAGPLTIPGPRIVEAYSEIVDALWGDGVLE